MTPTYLGARVSIASPIQPIKKIKAPPTEEIVVISKLAQAIHQQTGIRMSHLSMEEDTRKLTLTPDPHELMVSEPTETAHRLPGYFLLSFLADDNETSLKIEDGLDHSKVDWGS